MHRTGPSRSRATAGTSYSPVSCHESLVGPDWITFVKRRVTGNGFKVEHESEDPKERIPIGGRRLGPLGVSPLSDRDVILPGPRSMSGRTFTPSGAQTTTSISHPRGRNRPFHPPVKDRPNPDSCLPQRPEGVGGSVRPVLNPTRRGEGSNLQYRRSECPTLV